jgi:putative cell wall-binding protein
MSMPKKLSQPNRKAGAILVEGRVYEILRNGVKQVGVFVRYLSNSAILIRKGSRQKESKIIVDKKTTFRREK